MAENATSDAFFIQTALEKAVLNSEEADQILAAARTSGRPASALLVEKGLITDRTREALEQEIARSLRVPTVLPDSSPATGLRTAAQPQTPPRPPVVGESPPTGAFESNPPPLGDYDPDATLPDNLPEKLGEFELLYLLGQGGMGAVFRGRDTKLGRVVAIKVLSSTYGENRLAADRFLREARAAASVNHPNVITVYAVGEEEGRLYMALELLEGGDAAELMLNAPGGVAERRALEVIRDCARGLKAIEAAGLIHRDIKPSNIFITSDGSAKLADMGLARTQQGDDRMTQTGAIVGTPSFMAPEQARGMTEVDIRTDIYALGASLYALLTGHAPFEGSSAWVVVSDVLKEPAPDPRARRSNLRDATCDLMARAMKKAPGDRYRNASVFLDAVEVALAGASAAPAPAPVAQGISGRRIGAAGSQGGIRLVAPAGQRTPRPEASRSVTPQAARPRRDARAQARPPSSAGGAPPQQPRSTMPMAIAIGVVGLLGITLATWVATRTPEQSGDRTAAVKVPPVPESGALPNVGAGGSDTGSEKDPAPEVTIETPSVAPTLPDPEPTLPDPERALPDPEPTLPDPERALPDPERARPDPPVRRLPQPPPTRLPRGWSDRPQVRTALEPHARPKTVKIGYRGESIGCWPGGLPWGRVTLGDTSRRALPSGSMGEGHAFSALGIRWKVQARVGANATAEQSWNEDRGYPRGAKPGFVVHLGVRDGADPLAGIESLGAACWVTLLFESQSDGALKIDGLVRIASAKRPSGQLALGRGVERVGRFQASCRPKQPISVQFVVNEGGWALQLLTPAGPSRVQSGTWREAQMTQVGRRLRRRAYVFADMGNGADGRGVGELSTEVQGELSFEATPHTLREATPVDDSRDPPDDGRRRPPSPDGRRPPPADGRRPPPPGGRRPPPPPR